MDDAYIDDHDDDTDDDSDQTDSDTAPGAAPDASVPCSLFLFLCSGSFLESVPREIFAPASGRGVASQVNSHAHQWVWEKALGSNPPRLVTSRGTTPSFALPRRETPKGSADHS